MKKITRCIIGIFIILGLVGFYLPFSGYTTRITDTLGSSAWLRNELQLIHHYANNLNTDVLRLSLQAYVNARKRGLDQKKLLTVIDYSLPSTSKRLWVIDLTNGKTLFNTWVSHGKNSGGIQASSFSNKPGSLKSSIGVFVTDTPYIGGSGYSLRLRGLETGINDNAYKRNVVIHGARYVNEETIRKYGSIGRSWGCPAVSKTMARSLIDTIKGNTVVIAYYPDRNWLSHSKFLTS